MITKKTMSSLLKIVGVLFIVVLGIKQCSKDKHYNPVIKEETKVIYKTHVDTVSFYDTIPKIVEIPILVPDTVKVYDTTYYVYNNKVEDSLISGSIYSKVRKDGTLVKQKLTYKPKFPKYIRKVDSVFIKTTRTIKEFKWSIYGGTKINSGDRLTISPTMTVKTKKDRLFSVGYNVNRKEVEVGAQLRILQKRNK